MRIRIAIVEDERPQCDYLADMVADWAHRSGTLISILAFPSAEAFLFEYEEDRSIDVLLLDIEMGKMDGVSLARSVREENRSIQIIFVTGYFDYISDGYEVSALHYLLKPVSEQKLFPVLDRAKENLATQAAAVVVTAAGQTLRVPLVDIVYVEASSNYSVIVAERASYRVRIPISELEDMLDDTFYRCGRSFIVGLRFVRRITKNDVSVEGGVRLPLSRSKYDDLHHALIHNL